MQSVNFGINIAQYYDYNDWCLFPVKKSGASERTARLVISKWQLGIKGLICVCILVYSVSMPLHKEVGAATKRQIKEKSDNSQQRETPWISMKVSLDSHKCVVYKQGSFEIMEWRVTINTSIPTQIYYGQVQAREEKDRIWITRAPDAYSLPPDNTSQDLANIEDAWIPFLNLQGHSEILPFSPDAPFPQKISLTYFIMVKVKSCGAREEGKPRALNLIPLPLNLTESILLLEGEK